MKARLAALLLAALAAAPAAALPAWPAPSAPLAVQATAFPNSATVQRRLLGDAWRAGDAAGVRTALARLAALGYAPTDATLAAVAPLVPEGEMAALRLRFQSNLGRVQASALLALVPPEHRLVESIAWDGPTGRLFAGTVAGRALAVHDAGGWRAIPGLGPGSLFGLAMDPRGGGLWRLLWVASARVGETPSPETAFSGLIAIDRATLREIRRVPAPAGAMLADLAVDPHGRLYASDPASGAVYRAPGPAAPASRC